MSKYLAFFFFFAQLECSAQEYARMLEHSVIYTISEDEKAEIKEHYKLRINSEKGKEFADYHDYFDKFRKITSISVEVFDANGKRVKKLGRENAYEIGYNPSYEINDAKTLLILTEYQQYPYVIEVNSTIKLNGFISLPDYTPRNRFHLAVDRSSLEIQPPKNLKIHIKEFNIKATKLQVDGKETDRYEVAALPHIDPKTRYRDFYDAQPRVMVSPEKFRLDDSEGSLSTWTTFGDWFVALNSDKYILSEKTKNFISKLDKSDKKESVRKLYEYMQDRTRYVSIQLGIGGFKSLPTEEVEKFGYGDCKALTQYMKNMLDYAGIPSNFVLTRAGNDVPDVYQDFPSNQFNHVYLGIPSAQDTLYLECTSQTNPANYTGTFTDDRNVLWVAPKSSKIIRSRIYDHLQNTKNSISIIKLDKEGNSTIDLNIQNKGVFYDEIMLYNQAPTDYILNYNNKKFNYSDFTLGNFTFNQPARDSASFNARYSLTVRGLGKFAGPKMVFPNVPAAPLHMFIQQDELMKFCSIKRAITLNDDVIVDLPEGFWITNIPEQQTVKSKFGEYSLTTVYDGEKLRVKRKVILYKGNYTKTDYDEFREFYKKLEKIETRKLIFDSKT